MGANQVVSRATLWGEGGQKKPAKPLRPPLAMSPTPGPSCLTPRSTSVFAKHLWREHLPPSRPWAEKALRKADGIRRHHLKRLVIWLRQELRDTGKQQPSTKQYTVRCQVSGKDRRTFPESLFMDTGNSWSSLWPQQDKRYLSLGRHGICIINPTPEVPLSPLPSWPHSCLPHWPVGTTRSDSREFHCHTRQAWPRVCPQWTSTGLSRRKQSRWTALGTHPLALEAHERVCRREGPCPEKGEA